MKFQAWPLVLLTACLPKSGGETDSGSPDSAGSGETSSETSSETTGEPANICHVEIVAWQPFPPHGRPQARIAHTCEEVDLAVRVQQVNTIRNGVISTHTALFDFAPLFPGGPPPCAIIQWSPLLAGVPSVLMDTAIGFSLAASEDWGHAIFAHNGDAWLEAPKSAMECPSQS